MKPLFSCTVCLIVVLLLSACTAVNPASRTTRGPGWYTVKKSDTLYSIAWRYGLYYKELASWNRINISAPIHPGQRLRLLKPGGQGVAVTGSSPSPVPASGKAASETETATISAGPNPGTWLWPTEGSVLNTFLASKLDRRGIDIAGQPGQSVRAVADGRVVYSGNGLAGYGNLIIIKHSDTFLSAYAYCQERLVQEGNTVKAGNVVAKMGRKDNTAKLHFEIRRNGKPVDPLKYLPKR